MFKDKIFPVVGGLIVTIYVLLTSQILCVYLLRSLADTTIDQFPIRLVLFGIIIIFWLLGGFLGGLYAGFFTRHENLNTKKIFLFLIFTFAVINAFDLITDYALIAKISGILGIILLVISAKLGIKTSGKISEKTNKYPIFKKVGIFVSLFIFTFGIILLPWLIIYAQSLNIIPQFQSHSTSHSQLDTIKKPNIYLYPGKTTEIKVQLDFKGSLIADYPKYDSQKKGWEVTAYPDGTIINHSDNKEYSYLFWEGISEKVIDWDMSAGFIVKGSESREFLQDILPKMGLTPKEYNEFIVYWYPLLQENTYNLIHFADKQYTDSAKLTITPKEDSILRVFMVFKALDKPIEVAPQEIIPFERKGFTVVEWGGTEVK